MESMPNKDPIAIILSIIAIIISVFIFIFEKKTKKTLEALSLLPDFFFEYKRVMSKINEAIIASDKLKVFLNECEKKNDFSEFNKVYFSEDYKVFRDVHYFFELLGSMFRKKEINRNTVWQYFAFPLEFFLKTRDIRCIINKNNCLSTYAENIIWLFLFYDDIVKKSKNNKFSKIKYNWALNGETINFNDNILCEYICKYECHEFKYLRKIKRKCNCT